MLNTPLSDVRLANQQLRVAGFWMRRLRLPLVVACWLACYWASRLSRGSGSVTAWLTAASWAATHGARNLEAGSRYVTFAMASCALVGAVCRLSNAVSNVSRRGLAAAGFFLSGAPFCVLVPAAGAAAFLSILLVVSLAGWWADGFPGTISHAGQPVLRRVIRELFPLLTAVCFLTMSWQYNAQWLTRGLLIAAGLALLGRGLVPATD